MSPRYTSEDTVPPIRVTKDSNLRTNIATIVAIIAGVWFASSAWNNTKRDGEELNNVVSDHSHQLSTLQASVSALNEHMHTVDAKQDSQLELLRYLARDRKGPVPEAAK